MRHGSLFSGIGGFDLAAEWMGWTNVFHCEYNPFGQRVLKHYWPDSISYGDIKTLTLENIWQEYVQNVRSRIVRQVDLTANHAIQNECGYGEMQTGSGHYETQENGTEERKKKSLIITEDVVSVVESLNWNFSQLTTKKIMGMRSGDFINLRHGNLLSNVDSLMTTKSSATIATMQRLITEFVHIIENHDVDVISGGVPCQPASTAGKRKGKEDDRWLWPEAFRVARIFQPTWVVFENVRGLLSLERGMVFDSLLADLEAEGYEVIPFLLPACAVDAPHRRDRIWIVAHRTGIGLCDNGTGKQLQSTAFGTQHRMDTAIENTDQDGRGGVERKEEPQERGFGDVGTGNNERVRADNEDVGTTPDTDQIGSQPQGKSTGMGWIGLGFNGSRFDKSTWQDFPTQPPVRSRNDGLSPELSGITVSRHRKESIMAYGNAIVPQVAFEIFKTIDRIEL